MKKFLLLLSAVLLLSNVLWTQNNDPGIGDTIHAIHYGIHLKEVNTTEKTIDGFTEVKLVPLVESINYIPLELKYLTVDSVTIEGDKLVFTHIDEVIRILLGTEVSNSDTLIIGIYYHGQPFHEQWGGFHFYNGDYAFNLGVGFESIPHNLGKTWFPCVDDFTDRATYDFYITVENDKRAIAGGMLQDTIDNENGTTTWHWEINHQIPTYLASVAVGDYTLYQDEFVGLEDTIPITIYARPQEESKVEGSFVNIKSVMQWFEERFGPYPFGRIGYTGTELGAMEHATNIFIPNSYINGGTGNESTIVHELAHMWFGDKVTCSSAEDMWLNEGWATFCEILYLKDIYGYDDYRTLFRFEHREVLRKTHIDDGGFYPLNQIPQEHTYGSHAYDKGGVVTNALLGYLGDSIFFDAMTAYLDYFAFQSVSSEQMRDFLTDYTGIDMSGFFDAWVFTPGSPHFSIDSTRVTEGDASFMVDIYLKQKFREADFLAENNVVRVTFVDELFNKITDTVHFSGENGHSVKYLPFNPKSVLIDLYENLPDATTDNFKVFNQPEKYDFPETYFEIDVNQINDSAFIRATHNWVAPDSLKMSIPGLRLSPNHYWKIEGIFPESFNAKATVIYDRDGDLDGELIESENDSVVVLYREGAWSDWIEIAQTRVGIWFYGSIEIENLQPGEYTFATWDKIIVGTEDVPQQEFVSIFPNPSRGILNFEFYQRGKYNIELYDASGRLLEQITISGKNKNWKWKNDQAFTGVVFIHVYEKSKLITVKKIIFKK